MSVYRRIRTLTLAAACCLPVLTAQANDDEEFTWFGETADGTWLVGAKVASVHNGRDGYDDAANMGLVFGYLFSRPLGVPGTASIEFEYSASVDRGNVDPSAGFGVAGDWKSENIGMYFGYRSPGNVYFLGRLGLLSTDVTSDLEGVAPFDEQDTSFSYGAGLGLQLGNSGRFAMELEFLGSSGDNDINMVTLGGLYLFP